MGTVLIDSKGNVIANNIEALRRQQNFRGSAIRATLSTPRRSKAPRSSSRLRNCNGFGTPNPVRQAILLMLLAAGLAAGQTDLCVSPAAAVTCLVTGGKLGTPGGRPRMCSAADSGLPPLSGTPGTTLPALPTSCYAPPYPSTSTSTTVSTAAALQSAVTSAVCGEKIVVSANTVYSVSGGLVVPGTICPKTNPALSENLTEQPLLRNFLHPLNREELDVGHRHPLGLQQQIRQVLIAPAAVNQHTNVPVHRFHHSEAYLRAAVVHYTFEVFEQHVGQLLKRRQPLPFQSVHPPPEIIQHGPWIFVVP